MLPEIKILWSDRKRICGMPITFTKYSMSDDRLFLERGLLNMRQDEILLYRVRDISLSITLWQRIFRVGTITVLSSDKTLPDLKIQNVRNSRNVKEAIHNQVEETKRGRNMRVGEVLDGCDHDDSDENHTLIL